MPLSISAQNYSLIWSDEFDGSTIDPSKWTYDIGQGSGGWGNNELQYYTSSPNNVFLNAGYLNIVGKVENIGGAFYSSSRIKTQGLFDFTYGKVEARMKVPAGQGLWPAFWMLGSNISSIGWPRCGEIDIMEHVNNELFVHGTHHYFNNGHIYEGESVFTNATEFHVYAIEWTPTAIKWFLDGTEFYQTNIGPTAISKEEFHNPFFLILNLAIGGNWPGNPNPSTIFPATMMVDYVRVYQETNGLIDNQLSDLTVSPNPTTDILEINEAVQSFVIYNLQGEILMNGNTKNIDVSKLNSGMYHIEVLTTKDALLRTSFVKN